MTGAAQRDRAWEAQLRAELAATAMRPTVEYVAGLAHDDVLRRVRALGADDVVFTPGYFGDAAGRIFPPRESAAQIAAASGAPVYGPFGIGAGTVGGRMLKELRASGAIADAAGNRLRVLKRHYIPRELNENLIRLWGSVLRDLAATFEHNVSRDEADPPRFERRAISLRIDVKALPQFREMLEREGQAFLERIDEWLAAHEIDTTAGAPGIRLGVGVYHVQDKDPRPTRSRAQGVTRKQGR